MRCQEALCQPGTRRQRPDRQRHDGYPWRRQPQANTIIQYLADKGGKINAANKQGLTAYDLAMGKGGMLPAVKPPKAK